MDVILKAAALAMICVILYLVLSKQSKDFAILLTLAASCAILVTAAGYLSPIFDFFRYLQSLSNMDSQLVEIMLKTTGIGIVTELAAMICSDAGNTALGKTIQMLSTVIILWISLPLFSNLIELVNKLLGEV